MDLPKSLCYMQLWDFPGGPVVENPSCNAGDIGSIPDGGTKIPHVAGQATREPACHN